MLHRSHERKETPSVFTPKDICILERDFSSMQTSFILPAQSFKSTSINCLIFLKNGNFLFFKDSDFYHLSKNVKS